MSHGRNGTPGWQGASLVAITYVYFLIFAQFAFLARLASLGVAGAHLKAVMGAMAFGGVLFSLLAFYRRSLRAGIFAHAGHDFIAGLALALIRSSHIL